MPNNLDVHLAGIVSRDTRAFGQWMSRAEEPMRESLRSFARVVDVEAILQESLLRVWSVAPRFVADGAPNGLLRLGVRIARNLAVSEVRRTKARPLPEEELEALADERALDVPEPDPLLRRVLAKCLERLPDQPKRVLATRLGSMASEADVAIAESLGMRLNTFLQNFGRARKLLGECLEKNGVAVGGLVT